MSHVATVDYTALNAANAFARSMRETGFAIVVNHPVPAVSIQAIGREWTEFFATERKHAYLHAPGEQAGFFPADPDATSGPVRRDRKEFFHVRPGGPYPVEVPDTALRYFEQAKVLATTLLGWLDRESPAEVSANFSRPLSGMLAGSSGTVLRVQHYLPPTGDEPADSLRALAHTDINLLTVLPAPDEPGLQVQDTRGRWHDVPCGDGAVIINGGEMLEAASAGHYPATLHRVVNPVDPGERRSRMSLPLFLHADNDVVIGDGKTASEFLRERVAELTNKGWRLAPGGGRQPVSS
jgi:isopenicillin N synthase-like dioxygenase